METVNQASFAAGSAAMGPHLPRARLQNYKSVPAAHNKLECGRLVGVSLRENNSRVLAARASTRNRFAGKEEFKAVRAGINQFGFNHSKAAVFQVYR